SLNYYSNGQTHSGAFNTAAGADLNLSGTGTYSGAFSSQGVTNLNGTNTLNGATIAGMGSFIVSGAVDANNAGTVNIASFTVAGGGNWHQVAAALASFSATDFNVTNGTFVRALGGDGTAGTPYQLADIYGVQGIGSVGMLGNNYVLANNIDASGTVNWNGGAGFNPIGSSVTPFTGNFNGQKNTINGLYINRMAGEQGLFGGLGTTGVISNVGLVGGSVSGSGSVAALVAYNQGQISNSYSSAMVINSTNNTGSVGGLVGHNAVGGNIATSYSSSSVSGDWNVGGLAGGNEGIIVNSYATGSVTGTASSSGSGGLVGTNYATGIINNSYAAGLVNGLGLVGGLVQHGQAGSQINNSFWDTQTTGQSAAVNASWNFGTTTGTVGLTTAQMQNMTSFTGWDIADTGASGKVWRIYEGQSYPLLTGLLKTLTISADAVSKVYDGQAYVGGLLNAGYSVAPDMAHVLGNAYSANAINAGTYAPSLYSDQAGYDISYVGGDLTITAANITLSLRANDASKVYGNALSFNGLEFTPTGLINGDVISNVTLSSAGAAATAGVGNYAITAGNAVFSSGNASNYIISYVDGQLTVTPAVLNIAANAASKTYGALDSALGYTVTGGTLFNGDNLSGTLTRTVGENVGSYAITQGSLGNSNYTINYSGNNLTINPALLTAVIVGNPNKIYDGTTTANLTVANFSLSGFVAGEGASVGQTLGNYNSKNVLAANTVNATLQTSDFTASGSTLLSNYILPTNVSGVGQITPATLTVSGITATNKVYDGTTFASINTTGALYSGLIAGDIVTVGTASGAFADKNVGIGKAVTITAGITGTDAGNYAITTQAATTADITQATLSVSGITATNKVYDGKTFANINTTGAIYNGLIAGDIVTVGTASGAFADKNTGLGKTVTITAGITGTDAGNYTISTQATTTADITAKALTVSGITATNKVYDGTTNASINATGAIYNGIIAGDIVTVGTASGAFADKNAGLGKAVTITAGITGTDAGNYAITTQAATTADIAQATLSVSGITAANKVYDGTTAAVLNVGGVSYSGIIAGDIVAVNATGGVFTDKNAGLGKTVTFAGSLSGADAGNYVLTGQSSTTADISARALNIAAVGQSRIYDGSTGVTVTLSDNRIAGDVLTLGYGTASFADKNVGNAKAVAVSGINLGGTDAANYLANATAATSANITAKALTVSGITAANKVYDGTASASINATGAVYGGIIAGDIVTVGTASGAFADKNAGLGKAVTITAGITGTDAGNYAITTQAATTADITPRTLNISTSGVNKVYDGTSAATVAFGDDRVVGDQLSVNGSASFIDPNAAVAKLVNVSTISLAGTDARNYILASNTSSTSANITPAMLTVAANAAGKTEGGIDPLLTYMTTGLKAADTVTTTLTGVLNRLAGEVVGNYAINQGSLTLLSTNYTMNFVPSVFNIAAVQNAPVAPPAIINTLANTFVPPAPVMMNTPPVVPPVTVASVSNNSAATAAAVIDAGSTATGGEPAASANDPNQQDAPAATTLADASPAVSDAPAVAQALPVCH
ncbi:MAG: YDG domain-containing protein, partial [Gallionella sp.]|nr:YDG domain-containing protein [Gallionella sp.]